MFQKNHSTDIIINAILTVVVLFHIGEVSTGSKLEGQYEYNDDPKDPKMDKVFTTMGITPDQKSLIRMFLPNTTMEISQSGNNVTMKCGIPLVYVTNNFTSGKEVDEEVHIGPKIKTTAIVEGDKITFKRKLANGKEVTDVLECNDEGCVSKVKVENDKAKVKWKRVEKQI